MNHESLLWGFDFNTGSIVSVKNTCFMTQQETSGTRSSFILLLLGCISRLDVEDSSSQCDDEQHSHTRPLGQQYGKILSTCYTALVGQVEDRPKTSEFFLKLLEGTHMANCLRE